MILLSHLYLYLVNMYNLVEYELFEPIAISTEFAIHRTAEVVFFEPCLTFLKMLLHDILLSRRKLVNLI